MTCEVDECSAEIFAACTCNACKGNGPLLCFEHFEEDSACKRVNREADGAHASTASKSQHQDEASRKKKCGKEHKDVTIEEKEAMKTQFVEQVEKLTKAGNSITMMLTDLTKLANAVKEAEEKTEKASELHKRLLRKYVTVNRTDGSSYLARRVKSGAPQQVLSVEETFDILFAVHRKSIHGGINMMATMTKNYWNVTQASIAIFKKLCPRCATKTKLATASIVVHPIRTHSYGSRGQLDLIDLQSVRYNGYNWVMQYQDHFCKFTVLRPLKTKRATEVASELLKVLCLIGPPHILQSDNGREFVNSVLLELKALWPEVVIVNGRPRHPQSQGSVERANQDVKEMLAAWCKDNGTKDWTAGLNFVQLAKNSRPHAALGAKSPYEATFITSSNFGIDLQKLPDNLRHAITNGEIINEDDVFIDENVEHDNADLNAREQAASAVVSAVEASQSKQAERMVNRSKAKFRDPVVGDNVALTIDRVDRGPLDLRSLVCVVLEVQPNGFRLGTEVGSLSGMHQKNTFTLLPTRHLSVEKIPDKEFDSVRSAVKEVSVFGGQGFVRCACRTGCKSGRCKCFKNRLACNSRCHAGISCANYVPFSDSDTEVQ